MREGQRPQRPAVRKTDGPIARRCAIYTRKSSEEGLEQDFNSLHAQREACEAYISSQRHEGWSLLPQPYDDGGYSGGTIERPGLERLLADIATGRIDIVVVYKVDRLTRSLADFARIVDLFDQRGISFVSVTQAFNTTSSMGRLTLNVLLSFAQFEREVTAERIRDKIAASKRKGLWMGGHVPLGYRVEARKLVIDPEEAEQVQIIFATYLRFGSIPALKAELDQRGMRTRLRIGRDGSTFGSVPFFTGALAAILRNRAYIGDIIHKGQHNTGEHAPIVDAAMFEAVQARLDAQRVERTSRHSTSSLLRGLIFDSRGNRMSPSHAVKNGVRYPYYVSRSLLENRKSEAGSPSRVSAPVIDAIALDALRRRDFALPATQDDLNARIAELIERVDVHPDQIVLTLANPSPTAERIIALPFQSHRRPQRTIHLAAPSQQPGHDRLIRTIAKAHAWRDGLLAGRITDIETIARAEGKTPRSIRLTLQLAFLDPAIIDKALAGHLPRTISATDIARSLPLAWADQRKMLGV